MAKKEINSGLVTAIAASLTGKENITSEGDVFNANLPENLTPALVEELADYVSDFIPAGLAACGNAAVSAMKKDKKLTDVQATVGMGALGEVTYGINREKKGTPPGGEEQTYFGSSRIDVKFSPADTNAVLKQAKNDIKAAVREACGK